MRWFICKYWHITWVFIRQCSCLLVIEINYGSTRESMQLTLFYVSIYFSKEVSFKRKIHIECNCVEGKYTPLGSCDCSSSQEGIASEKLHGSLEQSKLKMHM